MYIYERFPLFFTSPIRKPPTSSLFPYTTLFRSNDSSSFKRLVRRLIFVSEFVPRISSRTLSTSCCRSSDFNSLYTARSEEHTSELQSHCNHVYRLLLEKKNNRLVLYTHNKSLAA